ncbi:unnamed protein product [Ectocarpus sp. 4 AP-2014]
MAHPWRDAAIATGLISSVPTMVLPFIPESATKPGSAVQRILLCFAVGGMMGDVFLHLLPHLLMGGHHHHHHEEDHHEHEHLDHDHHSHNHDDHDHHGHDHHDEDALSPLQGLLKQASGVLGGLEAGGGGGGGGGGHQHGMSELALPLFVLGGFMLFFLSERAVRAITGGGGGHSHPHSHGGGSSQAHNDDDVSRRKKDDDHASNKSGSELSASPPPGEESGLKVAGILNLAADALHNLSDGIAIGASFASGSGLGFSTALATLLHELPHEIGDFAVLVQSGCTKWQAIGAQFATAIAAFLGTAIGLLATRYAGMEQPLLAATGGGFVYVSCVGVMPEILNSGNPSFLLGVAEIGAMSAGIALMAIVALLE